jgi:hypothetical protein
MVVNWTHSPMMVAGPSPYGKRRLIQTPAQGARPTYTAIRVRPRQRAKLTCVVRSRPPGEPELPEGTHHQPTRARCKTEAQELPEYRKASGSTNLTRTKAMSNDQAEKAAVLSALLQFTQAMMGGKVCRLAIELPADVDKDRVVLLGLLPLIVADAVKRGRAVLWLAPDGHSEARANMKAVDYMIRDPLRFTTWDYLQPSLQNNYQSVGLEKLWVIGDLDWSGPEYRREHVVSAVRRALATDSCPALLIHQQGKTPVVPFPPKFGAACFIATAAFGENTPEVERLRRFRDSVLCLSALGRGSITLYERVSPMLAATIRSRRWLRAIVRGAVIKPFSAAASWALSRPSTRKRQE